MYTLSSDMSLKNLTPGGWQRSYDRKWVSILLVDAWAIPEFPPGSEIGQ